MLENRITLGDKLTIIQQGKDSKDTKEYVSKVLDFKEGNIVHIGIPMEQLHEVPLNEGEEYHLRIYTKGGIYDCTGKVTGTYQEENVMIKVMTLTDELSKVQRREYFRLAKTMEVRYQLVQEEILDNSESKPCWARAILTDISGGGARFTANEELQVGTAIILKLRITVNHTVRFLELHSNIISVNLLEGSVDQYETHISFTDIGDKKREQIIKFIFEEERKQLRREKGLM